MPTIPRPIMDKLTKDLVDKGLLIESGWVALDHVEDIPVSQKESTRRAFFAGAQHLFASIIGLLESGSEPTENDLRRMDLIDKELRNFVEAEKKRMAQPAERKH